LLFLRYSQVFVTAAPFRLVCQNGFALAQIV
jgi:hypothetical protein